MQNENTDLDLDKYKPNRNNMKKILLLGIALTLSLASFAQTMHLYGGKDHDVYLGCLNCSSYNSDSIWNQYGTYGSSYNSKSIFFIDFKSMKLYTDFDIFNIFGIDLRYSMTYLDTYRVNLFH